MTAEAFMRTMHSGSDEGCPTCDLLNIIDREREATAAAEQRLRDSAAPAPREPEYPQPGCSCEPCQRAASPRQGEPVDVERLSIAMSRAYTYGTGTAEQVAAEYAALSEPAEAGEPA